MNKGESYRKMITSRKWQQMRMHKLSVNPLCEVCESNGFVTSATEIHHKKPVESVGKMNKHDQQLLMFDFDNLMSVCHSCHVKLHEPLGKNTREELKLRRERDKESILALLYGTE